ncbi:MAG: choice-of-anchor D domain-containing protein [Acidobacteriota bacterium]
MNTPATQTVRLTSSGTAPLTISGATIQGTGFSMSGMTTPLTLPPAQTATLDVQFKPAAAGTDAGTVSILSNAASGGSSAIALSGTGTSASSYEVQLNWSAPASSSDAVTGYNVYRAANGGAYQRLNSSASQSATYTDTTVQSGTSYSYEVMSVDASGVESAPSNLYTAAVP